MPPEEEAALSVWNLRVNRCPRACPSRESLTAIRGDPLTVLAPVVIAERQCIAGSLLRRSGGPGKATWVLCLVVREAGRAFDGRHLRQRAAGDGQVMISRLDDGGGPGTFRAFTVSRNEGVAYLS